MSVSTSAALPKKRTRVNGAVMAYVDVGSGAPMVFLHGNPTSSYLWRNIMRPLSTNFRCLAPDLIGMGDSDKLVPSGPSATRSPSIAVSSTHFSSRWRSTNRSCWSSTTGVPRSGSTGLAGTRIACAASRTWRRSSACARGRTFRWRRVRSSRPFARRPESAWCWRRTPSSSKSCPAPSCESSRKPSTTSTAARFAEPGESRRPTLSWPRQLPIEGEPKEICALVEAYVGFLAQSSIPKLFVNADPGILVAPARDTCRRWPNQREVTVPGLHYVQEDSPAEIAAAIADWARPLRRNP